jgi:hypothetical protein
MILSDPHKRRLGRSCGTPSRRRPSERLSQHRHQRDQAVRAWPWNHLQIGPICGLPGGRSARTPSAGSPRRRPLGSESSRQEPVGSWPHSSRSRWSEDCASSLAPASRSRPAAAQLAPAPARSRRSAAGGPAPRARSGGVISCPASSTGDGDAGRLGASCRAGDERPCRGEADHRSQPSRRSRRATSTNGA